MTHTQEPAIDPFIVEVNRRRKLRIGRKDSFSILAVVIGLVVGTQLPEKLKLFAFLLIPAIAIIGPFLFPVQNNDPEIRCPRCKDIPSYRQRSVFRQCGNCFYPNPSSEYWKENEQTDDVIGDQWKM